MRRKPCVLLVYGTGGHTDQMQRLVNLLPTGTSYVALTPSQRHVKDCVATGRLPKVREDYRSPFDGFMILTSLAVQTAQALRFFTRYRICGVLSTGSGVAIVPSLIARILMRPVIFIESWSRIHTPSSSGRIMYHLASTFYVQHKPILSRYPKGIFAGVL